MSLTKGNTAIITFSVMLFILAFTTMLLPEIIDNFITGFASIASINVSVSITHVAIDASNRTQMDLPYLNSTNVTIRMPIRYYGNITMNLSAEMPTGFECGFGWYINESGTIKSISDNGTDLFWQADKTIANTYLYFDVPAPSLISDIIYTGDSYYERTFTIYSCCPLANASANLSVSTNYQDYVLYLIDNNTLINKSAEYHFQVINSIASFYGFNLSNKTFRIQAVPNATIVEKIIKGGGGGGGGGGGTVPLLNYSQNQQFFVEPNYINISSYTRGLLEAYITIYNLRGEDKNFNISYTKNFISQLAGTATVPSKGFKKIPVLMNTDRFASGKYKDYIIVKSGNREEQVTIELELLEPQKIVIKAPTEEQPQIIPNQGGKATSDKTTQGAGKPLLSPMKSILIFVIGLGVIGLMVFLQLRSKSKTIKYK